jgi:two-component system nitrogen regulation response regulator NtrX
MALDILIIDDEKDIRDLVSGVLSDDGYETRSAGTAEDALAAFDDRLPSLVLLDVWLRGSSMDGLELLKLFKARDSNVPVVVFSGHGNIDTAVAAIGHGAADFIEKPFEASKLLHLVSKATETERLRAENAALKARVGHSEELTGSSAAINAVRATLKKVAGTGSRMLIINGQIYHEGDKLTPELTLQQIRLRTAVLSFRGYLYAISY